jgi:catechol 2,3-dioxygenase-like lactoylglutathione lyase family enzyme
MEKLQVLETCLYARDLEAAEQFYAGVLGLQPFSRNPGRHVFFRCGDAVFLVFNPEVTGRPPKPDARFQIPPHGARGAGHVAFAVPADDFSDWRQRLETAGIAIESEVEWPGGGHSIYFRDPAGNSIELATPDIWSGE